MKVAELISFEHANLTTLLVNKEPCGAFGFGASLVTSICIKL